MKKQCFVSIMFVLFFCFGSLVQAGSALEEVSVLEVPVDGDLMYFGSSVAIDGDRIVAGDYMSDDEKGAAYVFDYDDSTGSWDRTKLIASDADDGDAFGVSVSVDGDRVVVGACAMSNEGAVYVFDYNSSSHSWVETQKIQPYDVDHADYFGCSVAHDGERIVIGSFADQNYGSVYIYEYNSGSGSWEQSDKLVASDIDSNTMLFGWSVALSGNRMVVGAYLDNEKNTASGAAFIFDYQATTGTWNHTKLMASDGGKYDYFGFSVGVDGDRVVVGSVGYEESDSEYGYNLEETAVYVYDYDSSAGTWNETKLDNTDGQTVYALGWKVAIDGNVIVASGIQSYTDPVTLQNWTGTAYVFSYDSSASSWEDTMLSPSDGSADSAFGGSVTIDGIRVLVGDPHNISSSGMGMGSVYLFQTTDIVSVENNGASTDDGATDDGSSGDVDEDGDGTDDGSGATASSGGCSLRM